MLPNLRSVIIAQVTRGGRSAVPRRNFSSSNVSKGARVIVVVPNDLLPSLEWMSYGCTAAIVFGIVQLAEYHRTLIRYLKKRDNELVSKQADADLLRKRSNALFDEANN